MCTEANKLKLVAQYYNNIQLMLDRIIEVNEYVTMCNIEMYEYSHAMYLSYQLFQPLESSKIVI